MMQRLAIALLLGDLSVEAVAVVAKVERNSSILRGPGDITKGAFFESLYGNNKCRCIGIDNLKGYYATNLGYHHVQYPQEAGASCAAWDKTADKRCEGPFPPKWCSQKWCYVDPCSCDLDILPKQTEAGVEYQGSPAYWSYATCGGTDFFSDSVKGACVNQKTEGDCTKQSKCAWNGKQCGGKEVIKTCKEAAKKDESVHGEEDCRCIGLGGKDVGKAFLYMNGQDLLRYPSNVGSTCQAWEGAAHPDCLKDGEKPSFCTQKWCFVDPCKCKTKVPPKAVMKSNRHMRFQGKTAYWSSGTCGSTDHWSSKFQGDSCASLSTEASCSANADCAWTGKECWQKDIHQMCNSQAATGMIEAMPAVPGGSHAVKLSTLMFLPFAAAFWS